MEGGEKLNRRFDNFSFILFLLHSILAINTRIYIETFRRRKRRMEISIHRPFVLQRRSVKNARTNRVTLGFSIIPSDSQPMNDSSINSTAHPNVSRVVLT